MKNKSFIISAMVLFALLLLWGCKDNQESVSEDAMNANQEMVDSQIQYEDEWAEFKNNVELAIKTNEERIEELKEQMKKMNSEFQTKYDNKILTLEQKNIELKKKLNEYKYEGKENWEQFKQSFDDDINSLQKSLNEIFENKN